ncbi:ribosome silencing factor [Profundibacter sp.]|uniref:ribosome silencing factor n=1 Tax=Profundibacter sp. TaxID=3101071 RepID=UPI003D12A313
MSSTAKKVSSKALLESILSSLDDNKAEDVVSIDLKGKSEIADYMIVCSGRSSRQVSAIAEKLSDDLKQTFEIYPKVEGKDQGDWVLIDAGDVIVHVFRPEVREFYQLEKLWQGAGPETPDACPHLRGGPDARRTRARITG